MNDFTYKVTIRERDIARYMKDEERMDKYIDKLIDELYEQAMKRELRKYIQKHYGSGQEEFEEVKGVYWDDAEY